jgi:4'-phosphopantetheinyl transferase
MPIEWPTYDDVSAIAPDEAQIWAVPLAGDESRVERCYPCLSADERTRAAEFRIADPRRRFVMARSALRTLLGKHLGVPPETIEFGSRASGKPTLHSRHAGGTLRFNLSHSGDFALIGITRGSEIGVDVERVRAMQHLEQIAQRYFHPAEVDEVLGAPAGLRDQAFMRCWTNKEAVLKAIGSGVMGRLDTFRVPVTSREPTWVTIPDELAFSETKCWLQPIDVSNEYVAAVAVMGSDRNLRCATFIW